MDLLMVWASTLHAWAVQGFQEDFAIPIRLPVALEVAMFLVVQMWLRKLGENKIGWHTLQPFNTKYGKQQGGIINPIDLQYIYCIRKSSTSSS